MQLCHNTMLSTGYYCARAHVCVCVCVGGGGGEINPLIVFFSLLIICEMWLC
jgi:hypothetical protein